MRTRMFLILAVMLSSLAAGAQDSAHFSERVERCLNALNGYVTMLKDTGAGEEAASIRRKLESYHQATGGQR